ncbi:MAG TPA: YdeI/OmpD-associated family protein [Ignavibacteria bacterium]|jgi:hypothetical protein
MESEAVRKTRLKEDESILAINPPADYKKTLGTLPKGVSVSEKFSGMYDVIHLFVVTKAELDTLSAKALKLLRTSGMMWIMYPKGSSKIQTDLTRDKGWEDFLKNDLKWIQLISFDETWSAFGARNQSGKDSKPKKNDNSNADKYIDTEKRTVAPPKELKQMLANNSNAREFFDTLSFTNKKEYVEWILSAKQEETKQKRLILTIEKLKKGMKNPAAK